LTYEKEKTVRAKQVIRVLNVLFFCFSLVGDALGLEIVGDAALADLVSVFTRTVGCLIFRWLDIFDVVYVFAVVSPRETRDPQILHSAFEWSLS
jgi:hypothetical protein